MPMRLRRRTRSARRRRARLRRPRGPRPRRRATRRGEPGAVGRRSTARRDLLFDGDGRRDAVRVDAEAAAAGGGGGGGRRGRGGAQRRRVVADLAPVPFDDERDRVGERRALAGASRAASTRCSSGRAVGIGEVDADAPWRRSRRPGAACRAARPVRAEARRPASRAGERVRDLTRSRARLLGRDADGDDVRIAAPAADRRAART